MTRCSMPGRSGTVPSRSPGPTDWPGGGGGREAPARFGIERFGAGAGLDEVARLLGDPAERAADAVEDRTEEAGAEIEIF